MIKIFTPNKDGKIELTKEELEDLLKEAETEGYMHGVKEARAELIPNQPYTSNNMNINDFTQEDMHCKLYKDEHNKMFYVDYENLPKYDNDLYEKAPYWMNPKFKFDWTCDTTACPSPDLETKYTTCCANPNKCTTTAYNKPRKYEYFGEDLNK